MPQLSQPILPRRERTPGTAPEVLRYYEREMKERLFHPVLYLQPWNPLEMLDVSCNKCQPFCQCCRRDKHIQMINRFALFLKQPSDFSILPQATRNRTLLKHLSNYCHIIKMFFFSRIIGSIKKLCNGYLRDSSLFTSRRCWTTEAFFLISAMHTHVSSKYFQDVCMATNFQRL